MDLLVDVLLDSILDTVELVPFLFVTYIALEMLEHAGGNVAERIISRAGIAGPAVGAVLGALPQCGFSAMAATLFANGFVTVGTLVAVILSTSDELIPVFLAQGAGGRLVPVVALKVLIGLVVGFAADAVLHATNHSRLKHITDDGASIDDVCSDDLTGHTHSHGAAHDAHGHLLSVLRGAAIHTLQVTLFIFLISLVLGLIIEGLGSDVLASMFGAHPVRATFLAALIGLIPNCGASVAIAQLYLDGSLGSGPMIAGLLASGGVGLLVLFRTNHNFRDNLIITGFVYAVGVACGLVVGASGIVF